MVAVDAYVSQMQQWLSARPVAPPPLPVILPEDDADEVEEPSRGVAEGQAFMIEYVAADGAATRRRVVVWGIRDDSANGIPTLYAKCLERNAMRSFRIDRIRCCIDFDGEVHDDVPRFMAETFGMDLAGIMAEAKAHDGKRWIDAMGLIRYDASLIAAVIRADGFIKPPETAVAAEYLERVAERGSFYASEQERRQIRAYVKRLRPRKDMIAAAINGMQKRPPNQILQLFKALIQVMDCDGQRHPDELRLINGLSAELLGVDVV